MVPKKNGKWRVCVDYSDLNNFYPKDSFSLPRINKIMDTTTRHELLSFVDAYFRYNQIPMLLKDAGKTAFTTPMGTYCYNVMSFGLKIVGATYQRRVSTLFKPLHGYTMKVYINDIFVKSTKKGDHVSHLKAIFQLMIEHRLKLNLKKFAFKASSGKFLGYIVSKRGTEATLDLVLPQAC